MWWSRRLLLGAALALSACGFAPVYGPEGAGTRLHGQIALDEPETLSQQRFVRRFEERMGRSTGPLRLVVDLQATQQGLGSTSAGETTRYRILGRAFYTLQDASGATLLEGRTNAFTGYSTSGSTVATRAAERDAQDRLMVLLADQVIDRILLDATDLPPG